MWCKFQTSTLYKIQVTLRQIKKIGCVSGGFLQSQSLIYAR